jgi:hypothetical protein
MAAIPRNFNQAAAAAHTLVPAAPANHYNRLLGLVLMADGGVDVTVELADGTDVIGPIAMVAGTPLVLPLTPPNPANSVDRDAWAFSAGGAALNLLLGGAVQVTGCAYYDVVWDGPACP